MNISDSRVNLIQGSVIYMKKMSNSKRGFTLTEILIVTAIVVIVSAAAFTGVAITLSRARETQKNLKENNGDNFENAARSEVDAINKDAADFAEIPSYKPKDSEATEEESSSDENSDESTNGGGDVDPKTTPTPLPTNTPTPKPSETSATTTAHNNGGGSGTVTFSGQTITRGTAGSGVMSIDQNQDGSTTIGLLYNQWNDGSVQVWKNNNGTYDIKGLNNGGNVIGNALNSTGVAFDWNPINNNDRFTLTPDQVTALESVYGIEFN